MALALACLACSTPRAPAFPPSAARSAAREIDALAWTIGAWHGTRHEPSTGTDAPLRATIRPVLGGAGIEEELEIQGARGPYRGLYLLVPDPQTSRWAMTYVNASRRQFVSLEGEASEGRAEWRSTSTESNRRSRLVYERLGPDAWRRTMSVSEDAGETWSVLWVDDLIRGRQ